MSHIFISYSHADDEYLQMTLEWLDSQGFSSEEIWYDDNINLGKEWRHEITLAIQESYIVLVILTENSAQRPYVIYEWAYALGHGIGVIPAKFDDVSNELIPDPLLSLQYISCRAGIPDLLADYIRTFERPELNERILSNRIDDIARQTYNKLFLLSWLIERMYQGCILH